MGESVLVEGDATRRAQLGQQGPKRGGLGPDPRRLSRGRVEFDNSLLVPVLGMLCVMRGGVRGFVLSIVAVLATLSIWADAKSELGGARAIFDNTFEVTLSGAPIPEPTAVSLLFGAGVVVLLYRHRVC